LNGYPVASRPAHPRHGTALARPSWLRWRVAAVALAVPVLLAGCGNSDSKPTAAGSPAGGAATGTAAGSMTAGSEAADSAGASAGAAVPVCAAATQVQEALDALRNAGSDGTSPSAGGLDDLRRALDQLGTAANQLGATAQARDGAGATQLESSIDDTRQTASELTSASDPVHQASSLVASVRGLVASASDLVSSVSSSC
jgi:hypothetical protein